MRRGEERSSAPERSDQAPSRGCGTAATVPKRAIGAAAQALSRRLRSRSPQTGSPPQTISSTGRLSACESSARSAAAAAKVVPRSGGSTNGPSPGAPARSVVHSAALRRDRSAAAATRLSYRRCVAKVSASASPSPASRQSAASQGAEQERRPLGAAKVGAPRPVVIVPVATRSAARSTPSQEGSVTARAAIVASSCSSRSARSALRCTSSAPQPSST